MKYFTKEARAPLKWGMFMLGICSVLLLSGCSDDDDDDNVTTATTLSKSVNYNAFMPILPEGIAYDTNRQSFLVSSASTGAIGAVNQSGTYSTLISAATFVGNGSFGLAIDDVNNRLHVASANLQDPTYGHLLTFDLTDATLLYDNDLAALGNGGLSFINDVTVDSEGNAYATNSDQGIIYKVDMAGAASVYLQDENLAPSDPITETGLNGIAYHPDGFLVVAHFATSTLYKVTMGSTPNATVINLPSSRLIEPDGIEIDGDKLYVVNDAGTAGFVSQFTMNADWTSGTATGDTYATGAIFPTTLVKNADGLFVNNSYFNFPSYGDNPTQYVISQVSFDQSERFNGSASEIPRANTSTVPLGYGSSYPNHFLASCTEDLAVAVPDMRGDWTEATVTVDGVTHTANASIYSERIEQCGDRLIVVSQGLVHDIYSADGTSFNGVNDVNVQGQQIHSTGVFSGNTLILTPVLPVAINLVFDDVTRELITDDSGASVLRFTNEAVLGRVVYMTR